MKCLRLLPGSEAKKAEFVNVHIDDIVVGDIIQIETGKTIPGDGLILVGRGVLIDESTATGESEKLSKISYEECMKDYLKKKSDHPEEEIKHKAFPSPILLSGTKV